MANRDRYDDLVNGIEPKKEKKSSGIPLIFAWIASFILFIISIPIECSMTYTIVFGLIALALFVPAVYFGFAKENICFTVVNEGTAKIITTGGAAVDVLLQYKDHVIDSDYNIAVVKGAAQPSFLGLGGLRFYGVWPFRQIYHYRFNWVSIDQNGEKKEYSEDLDYIMVKDALYWITVKESEDCNLLPLDIEGLITCRVINPYNALFGVQNWLKVVTAKIQTLLRGEVGERGKNDPDEEKRGYRTLVAERGLIGEELMKDPDVRDLLDDIKNDYGVDILKIEVKDVDPPDKFRELTMKRLIAQQEKIAVIIGAEAEAQRMQKVYSEIEARGDVGRLVRTLEMLEKSHDKWVISPDVLEAVRGLFGTGKKGP